MSFKKILRTLSVLLFSNGLTAAAAQLALMQYERSDQ